MRIKLRLPPCNDLFTGPERYSSLCHSTAFLSRVVSAYCTAMRAGSTAASLPSSCVRALVRFHVAPRLSPLGSGHEPLKGVVRQLRQYVAIPYIPRQRRRMRWRPASVFLRATAAVLTASSPALSSAPFATLAVVAHETLARARPAEEGGGREKCGREGQRVCPTPAGAVQHQPPT